MSEHSVDEKKVEATLEKRSPSKAEKTTEPLTNLSESSQNVSLKKRRLSNSIQDLSDPISTTEQTGLFTFFTRELNCNIFRFLDAPALCKAAQVSKRWRAIVDSDSHVWIHQFQKEGFVLGNNEKEAFAQTLGITNHFDHQEVKLLKNYRTSKDKGPLKSTSANKGSTSKGNDYDSDSDTAREDSDSEEEVSMAPEAASPSPTNNDPGQLNDITSESMKHPHKALFKRHWIIRQNWAKGRAKRIQFTGHSNRVVTCLQFDSEKIISG
ncbi:SCF ubiquitin ligase complex subunit cdc4, partial [Entomortierella lignicola]